MNTKNRKVFLSLMIVCGLLVGGAALAGPLDTANTNLGKALGSTGLQSELSTSIGTVVKGILSIVGTIFLLLTVYAGVLWMTAQGNDEKITKAKDTIQAAVIGLFIVMAAYAITSFVTSRIGGGGGGSSTGSCAPSGIITGCTGVICNGTTAATCAVSPTAFCCTWTP